MKWDGEVNEVVFGWVFASSLADVRDLRRRNFFFVSRSFLFYLTKHIKFFYKMKHIRYPHGMDELK